MKLLVSILLACSPTNVILFFDIYLRFLIRKIVWSGPTRKKTVKESRHRKPQPVLHPQTTQFGFSPNGVEPAADRLYTFDSRLWVLIVWADDPCRSDLDKYL